MLDHKNKVEETIHEYLSKSLQLIHHQQTKSVQLEGSRTECIYGKVPVACKNIDRRSPWVTPSSLDEHSDAPLTINSDQP